MKSVAELKYDLAVAKLYQRDTSLILANIEYMTKLTEAIQQAEQGKLERLTIEEQKRLFNF